MWKFMQNAMKQTSMKYLYSSKGYRKKSGILLIQWKNNRFRVINLSSRITRIPVMRILPPPPWSYSEQGDKKNRVEYLCFVPTPRMAPKGRGRDYLHTAVNIPAKPSVLHTPPTHTKSKILDLETFQIFRMGMLNFRHWWAIKANEEAEVFIFEHIQRR